MRFMVFLLGLAMVSDALSCILLKDKSSLQYLLTSLDASVLAVALVIAWGLAEIRDVIKEKR